MIFALIGNQNCGKTTLFNQLTGSNQHVGNFPGVTVDAKVGRVLKENQFQLVDLPGVYSLRPYTSEEIVTRDFLIEKKPDGILNIVDATNIERNLYLSLQLLEMNIPMVIALNMMDEVRNNGGTIDVEKMSKLLGVPVVPIAAAKEEGLTDLFEVMKRTGKKKQLPTTLDFCEEGPVHRCIHSISIQIEDHAQKSGLSPRFAAIKLIESDQLMTKRLVLSKNELEMIEHSIEEMETEQGMDRNAALADMRYTFIEKVCEQTVKRPTQSKEHTRSVAIDQVLTHKYFALPLFLLIMLTIFYLTFNVIGAFFSNLLTITIDSVTNAVDVLLETYGINEVIHDLVISGIFSGVGSVLSFLPIILVLFFFLSILEDSGYMARVAFLMDKLLRKIGLSGRSFVPMLIGFGCSVPAVMSTRTLASDRDRNMTIMLVPFVSCSAKIPIYAVFSAAFFPNAAPLVMIGLYLLGIVVGIITSLVLNRTVFFGNSIPFVMELPNYRLPSGKSVILLMGQKGKDFLQKAFTIIFLASIIIWFLQSFDTRFNLVMDSGKSLLAILGRLLTPLFSPLGFGDWRITTSLITGFIAKEAVVSTMSVLLSTNMSDLKHVLKELFTTESAVSFLVFTLLYTPCVAAIATIKRELQNRKIFALTLIMQLGIAWIVSFVVYQAILLIS